MNLDFVEKPQDREELVRLLARTGNSRLLPASDRQKSATVLRALGSRDYLESCSYLGEEDLRAATKGRNDKLLRNCLVETIKAGNGSVAIDSSGTKALFEGSPANFSTAYHRGDR